jgi:hypothetical protein
MQQAPPGWYTDPYDPSLERAWDGSAWTNETRMPPANSFGPPDTRASGTTSDGWDTRVPTWSPPRMPLPELTAPPQPTPATNRRTIGVIVGALVLPALGFAAGYAAHRPHAVQPVSLGRPTATTPATGSEPANVNVPGPTAPPGVDTAGIIARQNLDSAADIVTTAMQQRPGAVMTQHELDSYNPNFAFDIPGTPIGGPGTVGAAVISTAIDQLPGAPRRVVLALPGNDACYYLSVVEGDAKQYGVAHGADAASHCYVSEAAGGVPQVRRETNWTNQWPPATS